MADDTKTPSTPQFTEDLYPYVLPPRPAKPRSLDVNDLERVRRYRKLYGGCVSDAQYTCGIADTVVDHGIRSLRPHGVIAGRCVTVKFHSLAPETHMSREEKIARWEKWRKESSPQKRMMQSVRKGSVLVFDNGGDMQAAIFGEMSCNLARALGAVGVVNAGRTRDTRYIYDLEDFDYFTRGTTPNAYGGWRVMDVNVPIHLPGHLRHYVIVNPGDFVFGDDDGLQIIPKDYVDEVLLVAEEIFAHEIVEREQIRKGMSLDDVYRIYGDL